MTERPARLPPVPGMIVAPVPMRISVIAPWRVSAIIVPVRSIIPARIVASRIVAVTIGAGVTPVYDAWGGSDDNGCRDTEANIDIDAGRSHLRLRKQCESQEGDYTTHA